MIEPERIGRFLSVDEFGYVQPDVAIDKIGAIWKPLVAFVQNALMNRQGVRSVYLRGSIPRGLAIENISDADFFYFSETDFDPADIELARIVEANLAIVNGLELSRLDRATFDKIHANQRRPYFHMLLKTQCLFLAGDDIARDIEPFQIGPEMVSHVFSLQTEFSRLPRWLEEGRRSGVEQSIHRWFSRRIVRSGFEVTMDRSNRFTRDLYLCYEQFAQFYPDWSEQMFRVLINSLNGEESSLQYGELVAFLAAKGARLADASPR
ncbi:MAG TPA: hypothetical protein VEH30_00610 [Terriglobales bacterium]|nr:hypothetical protein [Terriglobales bacterium]